MRYIDADKLQKDGWKLRREKQGLLTSTYETMELDCAPTADVVEVVRCKDCKYNTKGDNESEFWNICTLRPRVYVPVSDEDYCSRGEKKDG